MAQGFVTNLNLQESSTVVSDRNALDNLGGIGISRDIQLFIGNTQFKSALINDPNFTDDTPIFYGSFVPGKKYKITNIGDTFNPRNWIIVGGSALSSADIGDTFTAIASGEGATGAGGVALEVIGREDFTSVFIDGEGWTAFTNISKAKVAFTEGTIVSLNKGVSYSHKVVNSDGNRRFQLENIITQELLDMSNVSSMTITRNDEVTTDHLKNLYVERTATTGSTLAEEILNQPFDRASSIQQNLSSLPAIKSKTILTYLPDDFSNEGTESGIRFDGTVRIVNNGDAQHTVTIGGNTPFGQLVVGEPYEIVELGNVIKSQWDSVGSNIILPSTPELTTGSADITTGKIYRIESLGVANIGPNNDGIFTFSTSQVDENSHEIDLGASNGLVVNDKLQYLENEAGDNNISGITNEGVYYVQAVNGNRITLGLTESANSIIEISPNGTGTHSGFTFVVDPQLRWNDIANTTDNVYIVGSYFKVNSSTSTITNGKVKLAQFEATAKTFGVIPSTNGFVKALEAPGLYILNPADDRAIRAFTDPSNPWSEVGGGGSQPANTIGSITFPALKTESLIAQSQNFVFQRKASTAFADIVAGEKFTITSLGSGRDWAGLGVQGLVQEGSVFTAAVNGSTLTAGSGGLALGSPKLILSNNAQDAFDSGAFQTVQGSYGNDLIADYTHTIPININGEIYYILAKGDNGIEPPTVSGGIPNSSYSASTHSGIDSDGVGTYRILTVA